MFYLSRERIAPGDRERVRVLAVSGHVDSREPLPMLNARRSIRGRELMPASSSCARDRVGPLPRCKRAQDSADYPHNESTLRRAISPVYLPLSSPLVSLSALASVSATSRARIDSLTATRRFYYSRRLCAHGTEPAVLNEMSQVSYRLPS